MPKGNPCKYGDPFCPCQDGDICHYEGDNPMKPPKPTIHIELTDEDRAAINNAETYTDAYRAGLAAMNERAAKVCEKLGQDIANDHYHTEPDTGAGFFDSTSACDRCEMTDDCAAAIRALLK